LSIRFCVKYGNGPLNVHQIVDQKARTHSIAKTWTAIRCRISLPFWAISLKPRMAETITRVEAVAPTGTIDSKKAGIDPASMQSLW
jgi:hypothetical protein